jgi:hypothetical protein
MVIMYDTARYPWALRFRAEIKLFISPIEGGRKTSSLGCQDSLQVPFDHLGRSGYRFDQLPGQFPHRLV